LLATPPADYLRGLLVGRSLVEFALDATAILGAPALTKQGLLWQPLALAALIAWVVGATLFAGDVSARAFIGHRLFPMAAPTGGTILIAAWLALAIAALAGAFQRG
jgi:uncharacterized membrane protein YgdD (TMEM256/DUF423 family)